MGFGGSQPHFENYRPGAQGTISKEGECDLHKEVQADPTEEWPQGSLSFQGEKQMQELPTFSFSGAQGSHVGTENRTHS